MRKIIFALFILAAPLLLCYGFDTREEKINYYETFSNCIYTTEKYVTGKSGHSIILGDENFNPKTKSIKTECENARCIYFSLAENELKPGISNLKAFDGSFEGIIIDHGEVTTFSLTSPFVCEYDGKTVHIKGAAHLEKDSKITNEVLNFEYNGPVSSGLFLDLWPNPSFKILDD